MLVTFWSFQSVWLWGVCWGSDTYGSHVESRLYIFLNTVTHGNCSMHASDTWGWDGRREWGQYKPVGGRRMGGSWYSVYSVETGSGLVLVFHGVITFRKSVLVRILMNFTVRAVSLKCQTKTTSAVARAEKTQFSQRWEKLRAHRSDQAWGMLF